MTGQVSRLFVRWTNEFLNFTTTLSFFLSFYDFWTNQEHSIVHPLHQLILNYNKSKKIVWTPEADACFDLVKTETSKCTTMHFLDDHVCKLMRRIMV